MRTPYGSSAEVPKRSSRFDRRATASPFDAAQTSETLVCNPAAGFRNLIASPDSETVNSFSGQQGVSSDAHKKKHEDSKEQDFGVDLFFVFRQIMSDSQCIGLRSCRFQTRLAVAA